jgi:hypothetical protein
MLEFYKESRDVPVTIEPQRYAVIDSDGIVFNIIVWDGMEYDAEYTPWGWTPPGNYSYVAVPLQPQSNDEHAEPGGKYNFETGKFTRAPQPEPQPAPVIPPTPLENLATLLIEQNVITPEQAAEAGLKQGNDNG